MLLLAISCFPAWADEIQASTIDILGEWHVYHYQENQILPACETPDGFFIGEQKEYPATVETNGDTVTLSIDGSDPVSVSPFFSDEKTTVLSVNNDVQYAALAFVTEPMEGELRRWNTVHLGEPLTVLFTRDRMIVNGSSLEYLFTGDALYMIRESEYEKRSVQIISDDAFIWEYEIVFDMQPQELTVNAYDLFLKSSGLK